MKENSAQKISNLIASLGVAKLCEFGSRDQLDRLNELGIEINARTVAEFLIAEAGVDVFRNKSLRAELLLTRTPADLGEFIGQPGSLDARSLIDHNSFNWGDNDRSRSFLELFGLDPELLVKPTIDRTTSFVIDAAHPLYGYQNWLRRATVNRLRDPSISRFLLHMPTGSGKTRTSLEAVIEFVQGLSSPDITVVWFAHSDELCEQAVESISKTWSSRGTEQAQILKLWGGRDNAAIDNSVPTFIVTSFQSAYQMLHTSNDGRFAMFAEIRRKCKVLIVDEAHQSIAPTYQAAIELFSNADTNILGLTATPGRHHVGGLVDETSMLSEFYGGQKIQMMNNQGQVLENPSEYLRNQGVLSSVERFQLTSGQDFDLSPTEVQKISEQLDIPSSVLKKIGQNAARTNLIATHAAKLVREDNCSVIVFAPSKENAMELSSLLVYSGIDAAAVTGESTMHARREAIGDFKSGKIKVLTNFGVLTTGFDAPNIDAVIVGRPTTSVVLYSQMIGRGLRGPAMGGTENCKIVDVVDNILNMPASDEAFKFFDEFYE